VSARMFARSIAISMAVLLLAPAALAQGAPAQQPTGKTLFHRHCAMCHNASGMGTGLLSRRMKPEVAELEKREDLSAAYVERFARVGLLNMPPITRGEIDDAGMKAIALYLSRGRP
jgi:mono/diheme cytochrome c family protein